MGEVLLGLHRAYILRLASAFSHLDGFGDGWNDITKDEVKIVNAS